ncbi:hypothetical protein, partial [Sphaerotilus sp.]|uniref:hypothetical protein n=1 Tax=Sphaerotilus sp. TaxID=2093942 RepID=UPI0034E2062A
RQWVQAMQRLLGDAPLRAQLTAAAFERAVHRSRSNYKEQAWAEIFRRATAAAAVREHVEPGPAEVTDIACSSQ